MRARLLVSVVVVSCVCYAAAHAATTSKQFIEDVAGALTTGNLSIFAPTVREQIVKQELQSRVRQAGSIESTSISSVVPLHAGVLVHGRTTHAAYFIDWTVGYSSGTQLIEVLELKRAGRPHVEKLGPCCSSNGKWTKAGTFKSKTIEEKLATITGETIDRHQADIIIDAMSTDRTPTTEQAVCGKYAILCQTKDVRVVEFLFATTRDQQLSALGKVSFSGSRASNLTFGAARVRIPEKHHTGHIELPKKYGFWGYSIYEEKQDDKKHFAIKSVIRLDKNDWGNLIKNTKSNEALVFVHGYNTTFEEALYRNAQIVWDLQYKRGPSILFTWASKGQVLDYVYDQQSALIARDAFRKLLRTLRDDYKVEKINVLAHSMGNLIVLDALAGEERTQDPIRISELVLAAPDVDRDYFLQVAPKVRKITTGMTLYCSAADKAMIASRNLASAPRAGDVPIGGPIILPNIDTIDVTALGQEFLGLNHDVFAADRSVMNDIKSIITLGIRPPNARGEARGVPEGSDHPQYWRYPN
jgi:esterase/lipase superfamily enzyme